MRKKRQKPSRTKGFSSGQKKEEKSGMRLDGGKAGINVSLNAALVVTPPDLEETLLKRERKKKKKFQR